MSDEGISAQTREYLLKEFGGIGDFAKQMGKHNHAILETWLRYRTEVFGESAEGLPKKYKELVSLALEVATGRPSGKAGERHARVAIRAGATPREVFDVVMLCEFFCGATNYIDYGIAAVRAAEDEAEKVRSK